MGRSNGKKKEEDDPMSPMEQVGEETLPEKGKEIEVQDAEKEERESQAPTIQPIAELQMVL